jgi:hypothetical protein
LHYWRVTDADFAKASAPEVQEPVQSAAAAGSSEQDFEQVTVGFTDCNRSLHHCTEIQTSLSGLEKMTI